MSEHRARIAWQRGDAPFDYDSYPRDHRWHFEGGHTMDASAAPDFRGNPDFVDPEEAFVASLSSCHMLTFLAVASRKRLVVDRYEDAAVGTMEKNDSGKLAITRVVLRPKVSFVDPSQVSEETLEKMHHSAHENCFIANSVRTQIDVE
jgi:organic hydroperoxide reductase OsmC/OhrA